MQICQKLFVSEWCIIWHIFVLTFRIKESLATLSREGKEEERFQRFSDTKIVLLFLYSSIH